MLLAGTDTTQTTLRWMVLYLITYRNVQDRIHQEITSIADRIPQQEDMKIMPYTYAFILEVLRLRPAAPVGIDHTAVIDTELGW